MTIECIVITNTGEQAQNGMLAFGATLIGLSRGNTFILWSALLSTDDEYRTFVEVVKQPFVKEVMLLRER